MLDLSHGDTNGILETKPQIAFSWTLKMGASRVLWIVMGSCTSTTLKISLRGTRCLVCLVKKLLKREKKTFVDRRANILG